MAAMTAAERSQSRSTHAHTHTNTNRHTTHTHSLTKKVSNENFELMNETKRNELNWFHLCAAALSRAELSSELFLPSSSARCPIPEAHSPFLLSLRCSCCCCCWLLLLLLLLWLFRRCCCAAFLRRSVENIFAPNERG